MNKEQKTKEYMKQMEGLRLSESARSRIKDNLLEYARFHGVRAAGDGRSIEQVPRRTSLVNLFKQPKSMTATIIAIALIAGGGTSYAAEGAVPGDFLYTVKTEVNENVKSAFAIGNEAEARLQARLAEERLEEAEELAARGELTAETSVDISSRLKMHYDKATERSSAVQADGDLEASATVRASLEGSLRTHADVLTDLNARVSGNDGATLISDIRTYADATAATQTRATATIETSVNPQGTAAATVERAEKILADVESKLARTEGEISADAHARVEAKFNRAVSLQAEAKASLRTEAYRAAYTTAQTVIRIASEIDTMLNSLIRIQLDTGTMLDIRSGNTQTDEETDAEATDERDDSSADVEVDTTIDTDVIDVETDASLRL